VLFHSPDRLGREFVYACKGDGKHGIDLQRVDREVKDEREGRASFPSRPLSGRPTCANGAERHAAREFDQEVSDPPIVTVVYICWGGVPSFLRW
jgi:hypothetical protein